MSFILDTYSAKFIFKNLDGNLSRFKRSLLHKLKSDASITNLLTAIGDCKSQTLGSQTSFESTDSPKDVTTAIEKIALSNEADDDIEDNNISNTSTMQDYLKSTTDYDSTRTYYRTTQEMIDQNPQILQFQVLCFILKQSTKLSNYSLTLWWLFLSGK